MICACLIEETIIYAGTVSGHRAGHEASDTGVPALLRYTLYQVPVYLSERIIEFGTCKVRYILPIYTKNRTGNFLFVSVC